MAIQTVTGETLAEFNESKLADPFQQAEQEAEKAEAKAKEIKAKEEAKTEPEAKVEEVEEEAEPEVKEEKPKKGKLAERFSEITAARNAERSAREAAEARATELAAKLEAYEKPKAKESENKAPDPKDFTDFDDYTDALGEWKAAEKIAAREAAEVKAREEAKRGDALKAWNTRLDEAKARIEDFDDIVKSSSAQFSQLLQKVIIESEYGPDLLYHFANDDDEAKKLSKMDPDQQIKYIGRLELKLESVKDDPEEEVEPPKAEKPRIRPPPPITPIKAKNIAHDPINAPGEFNGSFAEYKAQRLKQQA